MNFYHWSLEYILWQLTTEQVLHWYDVFVSKMKGERFEYSEEGDEEETAEEINAKFEWDEENQCFIGKKDGGESR